jgi:hypothetical protein
MRRAIVATVAALALVGCGSLGEAGSAATVGDVQISTEALANDVASVQQERGVATRSGNSALTLSVLQRLVITELVDQAAAAQGVSATRGEIDSATAGLEAQLGGPEGLQAAYLDTDVPAASIPRQVELSIQVQKLGATLAPDADPSGQQQALVQYVTGFGIQQGIQVSPRFGTWEPGTLTIGPVPSDLSTTPASGDPLADLIPAP